MTLWSSQSTAAILRQQRRTNQRSYKIKNGHVRYGNKWIPLDKFRHVQVLFDFSFISGSLLFDLAALIGRFPFSGSFLNTLSMTSLLGYRLH